jgi:hypothetical protein
MSKKRIELDFCDVCEFEKFNASTLIASRACAVCERVYCGASKHVKDTYYTTRFLSPNLIRPTRLWSFICNNCWDSYHDSKFTLPELGANIHGSGDTKAISVGNFFEGVRLIGERRAEDEMIKLLKGIVSGEATKLTTAVLKKRLQEEYETKLKDIELKNRGY